MQTGQPSRTAYAAAAHRAAHQILERGRVFADPLAVRILGGDPEQIAREAAAAPERRAMRLFIAARTRFAEDRLGQAVANGVRQLVVLGAGLDTFAYRNPFEGAGLKVFEVDHPATQAWKRDRLTQAGIAVPPSLTFAPVDFEQETLGQALTAAGFEPRLPTFFTWLGVVPYLTREAVFATLGVIAALPGGGEVVFDYSDPPAALAAEHRETHRLRADRVAALGEPWLCYFSAAPLAADLARLGFGCQEDLGLSAIAARYWGVPSFPQQPGGHVIWAGTST